MLSPLKDILSGVGRSEGDSHSKPRGVLVVDDPGPFAASAAIPGRHRGSRVPRTCWPAVVVVVVLLSSRDERWDSFEAWIHT